MEKYRLVEIIEIMNFGQIAIKVVGNQPEQYGKVGTTIYYDEEDDGALKFLHSGNDVVICKTKDSAEEDYYIILDK